MTMISTTISTLILQEREENNLSKNATFWGNPQRKSGESSHLLFRNNMTNQLGRLYTSSTGEGTLEIG